MNKVIAIVGLAGSGKSEISSILKKRKLPVIRFGDITDNELKRLGLKRNEKNEKLVRENVRKRYGMGAYAKLNIPKINNLLESSNVVIDGLYSWEEYKVLKKEYDKRLVIIAVYTPPHLRYKRLSKRRIRPLTKKEAEERDYSEIENINKAGPIAMADFTIINDGNLNDLKSNVNEVLKEIGI